MTALDPDPRVQCIACQHYTPQAHRCERHRAAGLMSDAIGPALARLPQHCPAHEPRPQAAPAAPEIGPPGAAAGPGATPGHASAPEARHGPQDQPAGFDRAKVRQKPAPAVHYGAEPAPRPPAGPPAGAANA